MSLEQLITNCLGTRDALALAREQAVAWADWLQPISADHPVGEDPGYDDDFQCMREEVNKLSGADVQRVMQLAQTLLKQRCKDLRVATYYLWARLHRDGEAGLADGLALLAALVEQFADNLLPSRPNSRRMALEWLAGAKVLDSLSRHPEVVKSEAERTVAGLVWLERALLAWPEDQRPALGTLYRALSDRLAQSGGVDAMVPQHSSPATIKASVAPSACATISSGRDLLDNGRTLATYLREQPQGWLAAHRLMKALRWDTLHQPPPQDVKGHTRLTPPRGELRAALKRLHLQQRWSELLEQADGAYAEAVNHFWLDLQWYLHQALDKLPPPQNGWAKVIMLDLEALLERLPGLETLCWNDGSPFADEVTRAWISEQVRGDSAAQWLPEPHVAATCADAQIHALEAEALVQADSGSVERALVWLAAHPGIQPGRQHWLLRLVMARVAEQCGKAELAIHLLGELQACADRQRLSAWEPDLDFEVKARLLKLLRQKSQRNAADKHALTQRMESLLAALVAIDPVRAAVLCD